MHQRLYAHIAAQSPEEIARQYALLINGTGLRMAMTGLVYFISAIYAPLWLVALCAVLDYGFEIKSLRLMKGLVPARQPWAYLGTLAAVVGSEISFCTPLAMVYQDPSPLGRPFAVGVLTLTMLQLGSVRVIHMAYAKAGIAAAVAMALGAILWDWPSRSGAAGLLLSLISLGAATYFVYQLIRTNHDLHDRSAREHAAARAADQAKSRFLAQMSHELRTPLNAILGLGHVELASATQPESRDRLALITSAARGLGVILDDILDMSAIEAGHLPMRPAPCAPDQEVATSVALYRPLFEAKGLSLTLHLADPLPKTARLDAQRLRQCLSNLLSNALKHTQVGGATVRAGLTAEGLLQISVEDSGQGIPPAEACRLFEPFQRGSSTEAGTGLGLSISRALARTMGGDLVFLPSALGAHFQLTLAFAPDSPGTEAMDEMPPLPALPALRVLVVDDIATNRLVAMAHLRLLGQQSDQAASGAEALRMITENSPDMVFLDMNMPEMDGTATLKRIRALPSRASRLPVIAMTADATEDHRRRYLAAGLDGYLAKPLTPEAVRAVLLRHGAVR